jgi:hypothetical protein
VKNDLAVIKKQNEGYENKIKVLTKENKLLQSKISNLETATRSKQLILSGPLLRETKNASPEELVDASVRHIKNVYNFELDRSTIEDCHHFKRTGQVPQLLLSLNNTYTKNQIIRSVINTDKTRGIDLNINEYLSSCNSNLLYRLRLLRKENRNKIFSCFPRNGRVFFKIKKDSRPKLIVSEDDIADLAIQLNINATTTDGATI